MCIGEDFFSMYFGWSSGHLPMSLALAAIGLRSSITNFLASRRISMMLFRRAKSGARGKEATKRVTIPNWMTKDTDEKLLDERMET